MNKSRKKLLKIVIGLCIVALCLTGLIWGLTLLFPLLGGTGLTTFSISAQDGLTGAVIADNDVSGDLWGATSDYEDGTWIGDGVGGLALLETVTDISDISAADMAGYLEDEYTRFWFNATTTADANTERPWLAYQGQWFTIDAEDENILEFYAHTSIHTITIIDDDGSTANQVNLTETETYGLWGDARAIGNFSALIYMNASEIGVAGFNAWYDPSMDDMSTLRVSFNFNETVAKNLIGIASYSSGTWTRETDTSGTTIVFETSTLTDITSLSFLWSSSAIGWRVNDVTLIRDPGNANAGVAVTLDTSA